MMWRLIDPKHLLYSLSLPEHYGDSIELVYRRADDFVGEVVRRVGPNVPVMIVSDHGFHSWRKAVNLDTWLVQNGYMTLKGIQAGDKKLSDLFGGGTFWENVDWSHTRAYAMGIGQIYFNLRGREAQGIVSPGAEASALADELSKKLLTMTDPEAGTPIIETSTSATTSIRARSGERRGAAGRDVRRLPRLVADDARGIAAGDRLQERSQVERGSRRLRLRDHVGDPGQQPADRYERSSNHRSRADGAEVLRVVDSIRHRWQAAVLKCFRPKAEAT
jgi:hypothetical protein